MKIRKFLQASVHLTIDERKALENALDVLDELSCNLECLITEFDGDGVFNAITMYEDSMNTISLLEKILSNIEK